MATAPRYLTRRLGVMFRRAYDQPQGHSGPFPYHRPFQAACQSIAAYCTRSNSEHPSSYETKQCWFGLAAGAAAVTAAAGLAACQPMAETQSETQKNDAISMKYGGTSAMPGTVYLVGAGPGAVELMTLRAVKLLQTADVVVADSLIGPDVLSFIQPSCEVIRMGKRGGDAKATKQADINATLVQQALQGKSVVRLKGGDPLLFGRVAEEMQVLQQNQVPFEIVPAITSPFAAAGLSGIPITHKTLSTTLVLTTGHEPTLLDFEALAAMDTLAVVMATRTLETFVDDLLAAGKPPETPVAIVAHASLPKQTVVTGTLETIVAQSAKHPVKLAPAVLIIGQVAKFASENVLV